jgi:hypothetical protein
VGGPCSDLGECRQPQAFGTEFAEYSGKIPRQAASPQGGEGSLPLITEKVLLDIDVDYLVVPKACHSSDQHRGLPWCWPDALVAGLEARGIRAELVTIAYPVEGGFTPLKWKYLGDELARRLKGVQDHDPFLRWMALLWEGAQARAGGNLPQAAQTYLQVREFLQDYPALDFFLASAYLHLGRPTDARECHRRARELDPLTALHL